MDQRDFILNLLESYRGTDEKEEASRKLIIDFVNNNERCFDHDYLPGHITGSALIVDKDFKYVLLNHHRKLNKWLQFGGHADGHPNPLEVAFREAEEESGLKSLKYLGNLGKIFDVDVHNIPVHGNMPSHNHYDIRIVLTADKNEPFTVSHESEDLKWIPFSEAPGYNEDPSFRRLIRKTESLSF